MPFFGWLPHHPGVYAYTNSRSSATHTLITHCSEVILATGARVDGPYMYVNVYYRPDRCINDGGFNNNGNVIEGGFTTSPAESKLTVTADVPLGLDGTYGTPLVGGIANITGLEVRCTKWDASPNAVPGMTVDTYPYPGGAIQNKSNFLSCSSVKTSGTIQVFYNDVWTDVPITDPRMYTSRESSTDRPSKP